jgi:hypothetical protein
MLHCIVDWVVPDISKDHVSFMFKGSKCVKNVEVGSVIGLIFGYHTFITRKEAIFCLSAIKGRIVTGLLNKMGIEISKKMYKIKNKNYNSSGRYSSPYQKFLWNYFCRNESSLSNSTFNIFASFAHWACINEKTHCAFLLWVMVSNWNLQHFWVALAIFEFEFFFSLSLSLFLVC